ncbi:HTTM domain-containing protein [Archangium sp. Cb G35]|uniref:HTTM domain-containing protein n=1 Tax=Archangium sp. Cb G35 TaxID=1920190 RepID=UPI0009FB614C|nr:HTTM domain-containing protein [Archangium sp. Cb G35]
METEHTPLAPVTPLALRERGGGEGATGPGFSLRAFHQRLTATLFAPVDPSSLVAYRVIFGLLMMAAVARFFAYGWIHEHYLAPKVLFPYAGLEWIRPWPGVGMYIHFALMGLGALGITLGIAYRASALTFLLTFTYAHLIDKTYYLNHYYFISLAGLLLVALPLDMKGRSHVPAWWLWLMRAQVGLVYFFGGVAKLKSDWLIHAQPMKIWLSASTDLPVLGRLFEQPWAPQAFSIAGAVFDLCVVPALLWKRTRWLAYAAVVGFHVITRMLFPIGMFPWLMMAGALLFFPPDWPRRLASWLRREPVKDREPESPTLPSRNSWLGPALAVAFLGVQFLLPLRHLLYPGDVMWTEEGYRFSWNVMLMEKDGMAEFRVNEPATGKRWVVSPSQHLSPYQVKMMATQPDMLLTFAHYLARHFAEQGHPGVEVRVDAFASLNGRPRQRLVDPTVNLATVGPWDSVHGWVLPFREVAPP